MGFWGVGAVCFGEGAVMALGLEWGEVGSARPPRGAGWGGLAGEHGNPQQAPARKLSLEGIFHWCQQEQDGLGGDL